MEMQLNSLLNQIFCFLFLASIRTFVEKSITSFINSRDSYEPAIEVFSSQATRSRHRDYDF